MREKPCEIWAPEVKALAKLLREEGRSPREISIELAKFGVSVTANTVHCWVYRGRWGIFE